MISVILLAAGKSERANLGYNKTMYKYKGHYLIEYPLRRFLGHKDIDEVILVCHKQDYEVLLNLNLSCKIVVGGATRALSVKKGLALVTNSKVMIHDGARCLVTDQLISRSIDSAKKYPVSLACIKLSDSLKKKSDSKVTSLNRDDYLLAQTPQCFTTALLKEAYSKTTVCNYSDDVGLVYDTLNIQAHYFEGDRLNMKVTYENDIAIIKYLIDKYYDD